MLVKLDYFPQKIGVKIQQIFELPPPSNRVVVDSLYIGLFACPAKVTTRASIHVGLVEVRIRLGWFVGVRHWDLHSLKLTANAPENRPSLAKDISIANSSPNVLHQSLGCWMVGANSDHEDSLVLGPTWPLQNAGARFFLKQANL